MDIERQRRREEAEREAIEEALRSHRMTERVTALGHVSSIMILVSLVQPESFRSRRPYGIARRRVCCLEPCRRKCERVDVLAQEKQRLWKVRHQERKQRETTCETLKETMSPQGCNESFGFCLYRMSIWSN